MNEFDFFWDLSSKQRFKLYPFQLLNQTEEIKIKPSFGNFSKIEILEFGSNIWNLNQGLFNQNSKKCFGLQNKV
jgi:hypothetical protein